MTRNAHDEARQLIALGESLSDSEQKRLRAHLVRTTQMRVRFHANRVREARERMWLIALACLSVGISTVFTIPLLWRLFAWIGDTAGVTPPVWEAGFAVFFVTPALVVSLVLLARGTHWASRGHEARNGK